MNVGKKKERLLKNKKDKEREEEIVAFRKDTRVCPLTKFMRNQVLF